nr:MAG TPA: ATP synthase subunit 9 [Caudoviricetes sp.]
MKFTFFVMVYGIGRYVIPTVIRLFLVRNGNCWLGLEIDCES